LNSNKYAVISLDVEDWYHLDYLSITEKERSYSMLDGLNNFLNIVDENNIKSTLFALSGMIPMVQNDLLTAIKSGHEVASHGVSHKRPLVISKEQFIEEANKSKGIGEDLLSTEIYGYRAPCFSINNELVEELKSAGYQYDSSKIEFSSHPLYGQLNMEKYQTVMDNVFQLSGFTEFELPTYKVLGRPIPVSGGGYLRIFPWLLMKNLISNYLQQHSTYFLYIHPFELSDISPTNVSSASLLNNFRFRYGQQTTANKLKKLIKLLKQKGYQFTTFHQLTKIAASNG